MTKSERYSFFYKQYKRFSILRGKFSSEVGGARLKRAKWHYNNIAEGIRVWPMDIRLRAFFASNIDNYSYFDPTHGFKKLAGNIKSLPVDIDIYKIDLSRQMFGRRKGPLKERWRTKILQVVSTGHYWVTSEICEIIQDNKSNFNYKFKYDINEKGRFNDDFLDRLIHRVDAVDGHAISLGVKSIIQDKWKENNPYFRACVHYTIAKRFFDNKDDKSMLKREFPIEPHWGRSRFHFIASCLKNLLRTCDNINFEKIKNSKVADVKYSEGTFPDKPDKKTGACDPYQVWSFCFSFLYQMELNGNSRELKSRNLSKKFGAYQLSTELIQLLSGDEIGTPHPALDKEKHDEFKTEAAYCLLDVGEVNKARQIFESIVGAPFKIDIPSLGSSFIDKKDEASRKQVFDELLLYGTRIKQRLDLVLILTITGELKRAKVELGLVKNDKYNLENVRLKIEGYSCMQESLLAKIELRISDREANILYLNEGINEALEIYRESFCKDSPSETAHCYIAALIQVSNQPENIHEKDQLISLAFEICHTRYTRSSTAGLPHEALGFRVALAHLHRSTLGMDGVAKKILSEAEIDIKKYGCSERTYMAFLLENGKLHVKRKEYVIAYVKYLRPCILRGINRGLATEVQRAMDTALACLDEIWRGMDKTNHEYWAIKIDEIIADEQKKIDGEFENELNLEGQDPLFGYQSEVIIEVMRSMKNTKSFDEEINYLHESVFMMLWGQEGALSNE